MIKNELLFAMIMLFIFLCIFFLQVFANRNVQNIQPDINQARMNQMKMAIRNGFSICFDRFQRCSQQLSATFRASSTKNLTFYIWARNVADNIMNGHGDKYHAVKCYPDQISAMAKALNIASLQTQPTSRLWLSIGKIFNNK